jgi:hypothetical protein
VKAFFRHLKISAQYAEEDRRAFGSGWLCAAQKSS